MKSLTLLWLAVLAWTTTSFAQNNKQQPNFTEGVIMYEIEIEGAPDAAGRMANGTKISFYVKNNQSKVHVSAMNGFANLQFIRNAEQKNTVVLDVPLLGEKTAIPIDENDDFFKQLQEQQRNKTPETTTDKPVFKYVKGSKRIAKHKCKRAELTVNGETIVVYTATKLRTPLNGGEMSNMMGGLEGFPLAIEFSGQGFNFKITAKSVEKKTLEATEFKIPEDCQTKSLEDFRNSLEEQFGKGTKGIGL